MIFFDQVGKPKYQASFNDPSVYESLAEKGEIFKPLPSGLKIDEVFLQDGEVKERPVNPCKISDTTQNLGGLFQFSKIPEGANIAIDGVDMDWSQGDVELSADVVGNYFVEVVCWPFLDWKITLEVAP